MNAYGYVGTSAFSKLLFCAVCGINVALLKAKFPIDFLFAAYLLIIKGRAIKITPVGIMINIFEIK